LQPAAAQTTVLDTVDSRNRGTLPDPSGDDLSSDHTVICLVTRPSVWSHGHLSGHTVI